jgi:hypothetical protein
MWTAPLLPLGDGLFASALPPEDAPRVVSVLDAEGLFLARVAIDSLAAPEYRAPPRLFIDALRDLAAGPGAASGTPLRPWLAGLAVLLLLAAYLLTSRRLSSRHPHLPM